jgi:predicted permease
MFNFWRENNCCFDDLTAFEAGAAGMNLGGGDRPELVQALRVSESYFRLFGARPLVGRTFSAEEDRPGGPHLVVMSYGVWQRRFGGDPSVLGKAVTLGGAPYTVIGILSPRFQSYPAADLWTPLQVDPNSRNQAHTLIAAARLKSGLSLAEANSRMNVVGKRYVAAHPEQVGDDDKLKVTPMQRLMTGSVRPALLILLGAVGLVLLIACANVANLLLARASARHREIAIRSALGAGRGRIVRQLLTESLMLAIAGGMLGLALGSAGVRALLAFTPGDLPRAEEMSGIPALDPWILAFTLALSVATGVLFGLVPAIQVSRADLTGALKEAAGRTGTGLRQNRTRGLLVASEMAIAVVLLCGAGLLIRSFLALHNVAPGFDGRGVLTMQVSLAGPKYASTGDADRLSRQIAERLEQLPGVQAAAMASSLPMEFGVDMIFNIPGRPPANGQKFNGDVQWRFISAHYFDALGIPLRAGRAFRTQEPGKNVIINEAMAKKFWPRENPVGQQILIGAGLGPDYDEGSVEIIGIVGNVREAGLDNDAPPVMYQLYAQIPESAMKLINGLVPASVLIRAQPGMALGSLGAKASAQLQSRDTQLAPAKIRGMDQVMLDSTARQNFNLLLLGTFAGIALLLAALGIYSVMSYAVEQRTHEIGIRTALGASGGDTLRLVLAGGMKVACAGVGIGLAGAFALTRLLAAQLYGVKPSDPLTFALVPAVLLLVALAASSVPAWRAIRVDPVIALRYE